MSSILNVLHGNSPIIFIKVLFYMNKQRWNNMIVLETEFGMYNRVLSSGFLKTKNIYITIRKTERYISHIIERGFCFWTVKSNKKQDFRFAVI